MSKSTNEHRDKNRLSGRIWTFIKSPKPYIAILLISSLAYFVIYNRFAISRRVSNPFEASPTVPHVLVEENNDTAWRTKHFIIAQGENVLDQGKAPTGISSPALRSCGPGCLTDRAEFLTSYGKCDTIRHLVRSTVPGLVRTGQAAGERYFTQSFFGRLGNQMFEYTSLLEVARRTGRVPLLPDGKLTFGGNHVLQAFDIPMMTGLSAQVRAKLGIKSTYHFDLTYTGNDSWAWRETLDRRVRESNRDLVAVSALGQHRQNFEAYAPEYRCRVLRFKAHIIATARSIFDDASRRISKRENINLPEIPVFIGVHVRRSDELTKHKNMAPDYESYLRRAMSYMVHRFADCDVGGRGPTDAVVWECPPSVGRHRVVFVVTSEDMRWCKARQSLFAEFGDVYFSESHSPAVDLALLAHCNHSIITLGTFGWWGAWLANGETVYWSDNTPNFGNSTWPPHWVAM